MDDSEYSGIDDHVTMNDFQKMQFKSNYRSIKLRIKSCKEMIGYFRKDRDIYHANMWEEKLSNVEHTLKIYDFFISLFPELME